jgi:hypothetical protein
MVVASMWNNVAQLHRSARRTAVGTHAVAL